MATERICNRCGYAIARNRVNCPCKSTRAKQTYQCSRCNTATIVGRPCAICYPTRICACGRAKRSNRSECCGCTQVKERAKATRVRCERDAVMVRPAWFAERMKLYSERAAAGLDLFTGE